MTDINLKRSILNNTIAASALIFMLTFVAVKIIFIYWNIDTRFENILILGVWNLLFIPYGTFKVTEAMGGDNRLWRAAVSSCIYIITVFLFMIAFVDKATAWFENNSFYKQMLFFGFFVQLFCAIAATLIFNYIDYRKGKKFLI